jgi:peptide deformylase
VLSFYRTVTVSLSEESMALLPIAKLGNPVLRTPAAPVSREEINSQAFQDFIDDLFETMVDAEGIGLAAPQVSRSQQVVVMECPGEGGFPKTVLINPTIVYYGPEQVENWEGCLSVDGLRGKVTRPSMVRVQALDRHGAPLDFEATGLYAVCIQHELDHLIGKVFLDRMTDLSTLTQLDEFDKYWRKEHAAVI